MRRTLLALLLLAGPALAQPPQAVIEARGSSATAIVETVDMSTRQVLLRGPAGGLHTVNAGPAIRNFAQLRAGDRVEVEFGEAIAVALADGRDGAAPLAAGAAAARPPAGQRPAGAVLNMVRARLTIDAVDPITNSVTFTGPLGNRRSLVVRDPRLQPMARALRPGQQVDVIYAETLVIRAVPAR